MPCSRHQSMVNSCGEDHEALPCWAELAACMDQDGRNPDKCNGFANKVVDKGCVWDMDGGRRRAEEEAQLTNERAHLGLPPMPATPYASLRPLTGHTEGDAEGNAGPAFPATYPRHRKSKKKKRRRRQRSRGRLRSENRS